MNRELNELKSRAINRAGFIGTVINMPEALQGVGSGSFSIPCSSFFATKKGKEILRLGSRSPTSTAPIHHHLTQAPAHTSGNIEKEENLETRQFGEALGEPGAPEPVFQLHQTRGTGRREVEAGFECAVHSASEGCADRASGRLLAGPLSSACSPASSNSLDPLCTGRAAFQRGNGILFSAQDVTP